MADNEPASGLPSTEAESTAVEQPSTEVEKEADVSRETPEEEVKEPPVEKVVPLAALHEERTRRKEAQRQLNEQAQRFDTLNQRLNTLQSLAERQNQPQMPNPGDDPLGFQLVQTAQVADQVTKLSERIEKQDQEKQQERNWGTFVEQVRAADAEFTQRQPDAPEAIAFLKQRKFEEYQAAGQSAIEARNLVLRDEQGLCIQSMRNGENPAERAYEIAKALGYTPSKEKLEMQKAGQAASTPSGGNKGSSKVSLDALLKMSDKEFSEKTAGDNWKKLMQV